MSSGRFGAFARQLATAVVKGLTEKSGSSKSSSKGPGGSSGARPSPKRRQEQRPPVGTDRTDGVDVSYAPERDGDADPGEVVWTWVPYEDDPSQGKDRPVLIVGWDGSKLAGVQLSSKNHSDRRDAADWVPVGTGAWDSQGRPSYADAGRLLRIDPSAVRREGAALDRRRFDDVIQRVEAIHDWHR